MAPILIGSLEGAPFAGAGLAWAITIGTEMMLKIKTKIVKIANFFIAVPPFFPMKLFSKKLPQLLI
jgi:hypothetical protein